MTKPIMKAADLYDKKLVQIFSLKTGDYIATVPTELAASFIEPLTKDELAEIKSEHMKNQLKLF